ncbi:response regulator [Salininema proteolyticum]|uniref:Two-component system response regulator n=1 Tax=Salininema proteolyticum TaxID=1607685 RepID=A0ABV8U1T9_9ACTN
MSTARVLLVDDRNENLVALEAILQGLPVECVVTRSGEEALRQLLRGEFAAILLDAQMPGMDGFETAGHIKQRERTRHTPIIFLTAADRDSHLEMRGYSVGAVDYITKPFDPWMLRTKVKVFIDLWNRGEELRETHEHHLRLQQRHRELADRLSQAGAQVAKLRAEHPDLDLDELERLVRAAAE